jgi:hypothetical protein
MTTITQKKKLSKSAWVLLGVAFIAVIVLAVCALLGLIDLSPLSNGYLAIFMWASGDIVNGLITGLGIFVLGILFYYVAVRYFIGNKVTTTSGTPGYAPIPTYPTSQPSQSGEETKIS